MQLHVYTMELGLTHCLSKKERIEEETSAACSSLSVLIPVIQIEGTRVQKAVIRNMDKLLMFHSIQVSLQ